MEQDGRGKPPPGELSSFDISKRGGADVAAELAKRMASWRNARKRLSGPTSGPPAGVTSPGPPATMPAADRPTLPPELDAAMVTRIDRALRMAVQAPAPQSEIVWPRSRPAQVHSAKGLLTDSPNPSVTATKPERRLASAPRRVRAIGTRIKEAGISAGGVLQARSGQTLRRAGAIGAGAQGAAIAAARTLRVALQVHAGQAPQRARAIGTAARRSSVAAWHALRPALGRFADETQRHMHAIGAAAWRARTDRIVIAGAAAIAVAIAGWFLVRTDRPLAPEAPRLPDVASAPDALVAPATVQPPSLQQAAVATTPAPEGHASDALPVDSLGARVPPRLKPVLRAPVLVARLKPSDASMLSGGPQAAPATDVTPAKPPQQTGDGSSGGGDPRAADSALNRMVGDGLSQ